MRVWGSIPGAVLLGMLAMAVPAASAAGDHLTTNTAEEVSEKMITERIDKSRRLESARFELCYRRSPLRVDCDFEATGESTKATIECDFTVSVRLVDQRPVGQFEVARCKAKEKPLLTYADAYRAMAAVASETIGLPVAESRDPDQPARALLSLLRTSRSSFQGQALWEPFKSGGQADFCVLELTARAGARVIVEVGKLVCLA